MTIRTNKMLAVRTDHYGPTAKLWFPCNEGTGNTITDIIAGVVISDEASIGHSDEPHAVNILNDTTGYTGTGISNLQIPKVGLCIAVFKANATTALSLVQLGGSSTPGIQLSAVSNMLTVAPSVLESNPPTTPANANEYVVHAIAWDTTTGYCYFDAAATKAGLAVTLENSSALTAGVSTALPVNFDDNVTISQLNPIDLYGIALFDFGTALPSDVLTGVQTMAKRWLYGEKTLYEPWASL